MYTVESGRGLGVGIVGWISWNILKDEMVRGMGGYGVDRGGE